MAHQFHSNEQRPQKASTADLSEAKKTMGAPFLGWKFKLKIEQGTEVGVEWGKLQSAFIRSAEQ